MLEGRYKFREVEVKPTRFIVVLNYMKTLFGYVSTPKREVRLVKVLPGEVGYAEAEYGEVVMSPIRPFGLSYKKS